MGLMGLRAEEREEQESPGGFGHDKLRGGMRQQDRS